MRLWGGGEGGGRCLAAACGAGPDLQRQLRAFPYTQSLKFHIPKRLWRVLTVACASMDLESILEGCFVCVWMGGVLGWSKQARALTAGAWRGGYSARKGAHLQDFCHAHGLLRGSAKIVGRTLPLVSASTSVRGLATLWSFCACAGGRLTPWPGSKPRHTTAKQTERRAGVCAPHRRPRRLRQAARLSRACVHAGASSCWRTCGRRRPRTTLTLCRRPAGSCRDPLPPDIARVRAQQS